MKSDQYDYQYSSTIFKRFLLDMHRARGSRVQFMPTSYVRFARSYMSYKKNKPTELIASTDSIVELKCFLFQLDTIEEFVSAIETALKSCSDQICLSLSNNSNSNDKSPLMGVSRVGLLVKNLLIKTDRLFHIVVICTEWPTMNLFEKIFSLLPENFNVNKLLK